MDPMVVRALEIERVRAYNNDILSTLKPGDIVKFQRNVFHHFAIYVGNNKVIHKRGTASGNVGPSGVTLFDRPQKVRVVEEPFMTVAGSDKAERYNQYDVKKTPFPGDIIVERAESKVGEEVYQALYKNCEHFVYWCRYGEEFSQQSQLVTATVTMGSLVGGLLFAGPIGGIAALSASAYMLYKHHKEQEEDLLTDTEKADRYFKPTYKYN